MPNTHHEQLAEISAQLTGLSSELTRISGLASTALRGAAQTLLCADLSLAQRVSGECELIAAMSVRAQRAAFKVLTLQAPGAGDVRVIVTAIQIVADLDRMGTLALHIAAMAHRRQLEHAVSLDCVDQVAEMGRVAAELGHMAQAVPVSGDPQPAAKCNADRDARGSAARHRFTSLTDAP